MTRDLLYREGVCPSFAEPRQKNVAQRVYHAVFWKLQICSKLFVKMVERSDQGRVCQGDWQIHIPICSPAIDSPSDFARLTLFLPIVVLRSNPRRNSKLRNDK